MLMWIQRTTLQTWHRAKRGTSTVPLRAVPRKWRKHRVAKHSVDDWDTRNPGKNGIWSLSTSVYCCRVRSMKPPNLRTVEGPIDKGIINNVTTLRVGNVQDPDDDTNFQTALRFANDNDSEWLVFWGVLDGFLVGMLRLTHLPFHPRKIQQKPTNGTKFGLETLDPPIPQWHTSTFQRFSCCNCLDCNNGTSSGDLLIYQECWNWFSKRSEFHGISYQ